MPADVLDRDPLQHPKLARLFDLWNRRREGRTMPARRDIDTIELREWLGDLILVEVVEGGASYRYRVYGTKLVDLFGHELTGKAVSHFASARQPLIAGDYDQVRRERKPVYFDRQVVIRGERARVQILALPLSANDAEVDMILAAVYAIRSGSAPAPPPGWAGTTTPSER
jgi:hypothetical protein